MSEFNLPPGVTSRDIDGPESDEDREWREQCEEMKAEFRKDDEP